MTVLNKKEMLNKLSGFGYSKKYKFFFRTKKDYFRQLYNVTDVHYWNKNHYKKKEKKEAEKPFKIERGKIFIYFN